MRPPGAWTPAPPARPRRLSTARVSAEGGVACLSCLLVLVTSIRGPCSLGWGWGGDQALFKEVDSTGTSVSLELRPLDTLESAPKKQQHFHFRGPLARSFAMNPWQASLCTPNHLASLEVVAAGNVQQTAAEREHMDSRVLKEAASLWLLRFSHVIGLARRSHSPSIRTYQLRTSAS